MEICLGVSVVGLAGVGRGDSGCPGCSIVGEVFPVYWCLRTFLLISQIRVYFLVLYIYCK